GSKRVRILRLAKLKPRLSETTRTDRCPQAARRMIDGEDRLDLVPLKELLADHHALNLGGSLADQQQRRVAVKALDLVLLRVAVPAVNAEALLDALLAGLGGEQLRHPGLEVGALAGVLHPRRLAGDQARRLDLGRHVGELELDRLVLGDRLAEGLALLAV